MTSYTLGLSLTRSVSLVWPLGQGYHWIGLPRKSAMPTDPTVLAAVARVMLAQAAQGGRVCP